MKAIRSSTSRTIPVGCNVTCIDNSGAKIIQVISVKGWKGVKRRQPAAGIASMIKATVKAGDVKGRKTVVDAVIVRQKKEYRRANGLRVSFEDNAAVLVNELGEPKGTEVKGPIAKEVVERFSAIGKIANTVV